MQINALLNKNKFDHLRINAENELTVKKPW